MPAPAAVRTTSTPVASSAPRTTSKGANALKHAIVGLDSTLATIYLLKMPLYDLKTTLQLFKGQEKPIVTMQRTWASPVRRWDAYAELTRIFGGYAFDRLFKNVCHIRDNRVERVMRVAFASAAVGYFEQQRLQKRVELVAGSNGSGATVTKTATKSTSPFLALIESITPFIAYETLVALIAEYLVRPRITSMISSNFTFIKNDRELQAWSESLSHAVARAVTVPLETGVKKAVSRREVTYTEEIENKKVAEKKCYKATAIAALLSVTQALGPVTELYLYRAGTAIVDKVFGL